MTIYLGNSKYLFPWKVSKVHACIWVRKIFKIRETLEVHFRTFHFNCNRQHIQRRKKELSAEVSFTKNLYSLSTQMKWSKPPWFHSNNLESSTPNQFSCRVISKPIKIFYGNFQQVNLLKILTCSIDTDTLGFMLLITQFLSSIESWTFPLRN